MIHNDLKPANSIFGNEDNSENKSDDNMYVYSGTFSDIDEDNVSNCTVYRDSMLDESGPTAVQLEHVPYEINTHTELIFASGEGHMPLSIFRDEDAENDFQQFSVDKENLTTVNIMLMFTTVLSVNMNYIQLIEEQQ